MKAAADTLLVARSNLIERRVSGAAKRCPGLSQGRGRAPIGADPLAGGRASDLRVPAHYATGEPVAKGRRQARYQCRAGAADHEPTDPGTTHWAAASAQARRHRNRPALECSLVLRSLRACLRNGEIVRVLFAIDACDRDIIAWSATTTGISGEMVRDLMVACVERRFGISKAPQAVEWLSDNGSAYIAKNTLDTATALGLNLCFTPVCSPESNGVAEAFVKTFKRDYARLSILQDTSTVIMLLPTWFEDYNDIHPHSGLKFLSLREFLHLSA
jgi:putative transposase